MIQDLVDGLEVLGESMDNALILESAKALEESNRRYEIVRRLTPKEFKDVCLENLKHGISFDDLVDDINVKHKPKMADRRPTWLLPVCDKTELHKAPEDEFDDSCFICMDESLSEYHGDKYVWLYRDGEWGDKPIIYVAPTMEEHFVTVKSSLDFLKLAFKNDPDFAYTWHCNIAMIAMDIIDSQTGIKSSHKTANHIATALMKYLFDIETQIKKGDWK